MKKIVNKIKKYIPFKKHIMLLLELLFGFQTRKNKILSRYLGKYIKDYEINFPNEDRSSCNTIWQYWAQGFDQAPEIIQACVKSVWKHRGERIIVYLDDNNIAEYIEIPEFILEKKKNGIISNTHFSDILRIMLLSKYGGVWMDATIYMTGPISDKIEKSIFFAYSIDKENRNYKYHGFSSWFIFAKKSSLITKAIERAIIYYWYCENELKDYFLFHLISKRVILSSEKLTHEWNGVDYISNASPHLLQSVLLKKFNRDEYNDIVSKTNIHKLTYKGLVIEKDTTLAYLLRAANTTYPRSVHR